MKHVIRIALMVLFIPMAASAQWQFAGVFPDSTTYTNSHGMVVDADGKLWNGPYYSNLYDNERRSEIFIFNADGTQTDFSPMHMITVADTTFRFGSVTGMNKGVDGNIYVAMHGFRLTAATEGAVVGGVWNTSRAFILVLNPADGSLVEIVDVTAERVPATATASSVSHAPNRPAVTEDGFVAISYVFPASPIVILDPSDDWNVVSTVTSDKLGFSRSLEISADGTMIFNPQTEAYTEGGTPGHIQVLEGDDVFSEYSVGLPLATGTDPGAISRYPNSNILFASGAGSGNAPLSDATIGFRVYGYSLDSRSVVDYFDWNYGSDNDAYRIPRGLAFSEDGLTAYFGSFNAGSGNIQKFTRSEPVSIERGGEIASGFTLEQNYPNPFNPTTTISYTLGDAGMTTIRVYDMLGRVVATLVNQEMPAGTHNVNFNAANLGSGVYLYELTSGNVRLTNKMTLVK